MKTSSKTNLGIRLTLPSGLAVVLSFLGAAITSQAGLVVTQGAPVPMQRMLLLSDGTVLTANKVAALPSHIQDRADFGRAPGCLDHFEEANQ
jgi:hypothetical protein